MDKMQGCFAEILDKNQGCFAKKMDKSPVHAVTDPVQPAAARLQGAAERVHKAEGTGSQQSYNYKLCFTF